MISLSPFPPPPPSPPAPASNPDADGDEELAEPDDVEPYEPPLPRPPRVPYFEIAHKFQDLVNRVPWNGCGFSSDGEHVIGGEFFFFCRGGGDWGTCLVVTEEPSQTLIDRDRSFSVLELLSVRCRQQGFAQHLHLGSRLWRTVKDSRRSERPPRGPRRESPVPFSPMSSPPYFLPTDFAPTPLSPTRRASGIL